jgi:hypothetical protein|tara:strand:- start:1535 stop:1804 length:270 start_codon:yes stop_codon:yes gene_type:complete
MDIPEGLIRKVIVSAGDRDITYLRGQTIAKGALHIVDITFDKAYSEHYNEVRYNIYVVPRGEKYTRLWKSIPGSKCVPEYELGIEKQIS